MDKITFDFNGKTAVITGGAQGFGLDIAKRFLKSGAKVIIWDVDSKMLEKAIKDLDNPNLSSNIVDVSNYKEVEKCTNKITESSNINAKNISGIQVTSPIIGTAYHAPEPGAKKFVEIGKKIKKGETVMIVEAMKTMNHVPSTSDGVVKEICVKDGQPVEFGQTIIILE